MKNKLALCFAAVASVIGLASCGNADKTPKEPIGITVTTEPTKMQYVVGESFDPTGMVVSLEYKDHTFDPITDYTIKVADPLQKNTKTVTIEYEKYSTAIYLDVVLEGNTAKYDVAHTPELESSPLEGKTFFYLGSSVTYGAQSGAESYVDYIAKRNKCTSIKEAVSATTLVNKKSAQGKNYIVRYDEYLARTDRTTKLDGFICQLGTNDASTDHEIGTLTDSKDISTFDQTTVIGAIEYITAKTKEVYDCPVYFYTNPYFDTAKTERYRLMVDALLQVQTKWDITVLNMFDDKDINDITEEQRALYLSDAIHPTKAGYRDWWTPLFEDMLANNA